MVKAEDFATDPRGHLGRRQRPHPRLARLGRSLFGRSATVAKVVVDVMPKRAILDPQGRAVAGALGRLGFAGVSDVRQGKRFELEVEGELTEERLAELRRAAETLLANTVIEDFTVRVEPATAQA